MVITFEETQIEKPHCRTFSGKFVSYRWVRALWVIVDGKKYYPPMQVRAAKKFAKELAQIQGSENVQ